MFDSKCIMGQNEFFAGQYNLGREMFYFYRILFKSSSIGVIIRLSFSPPLGENEPVGWEGLPLLQKGLGMKAMGCRPCARAREPSTGDTGARPSPSPSGAAAGRPSSAWSDCTLRPSQPLSNFPHDPSSTHPSPGQEASLPADLAKGWTAWVILAMDSSPNSTWSRTPQEADCSPRGIIHDPIPQIPSLQMVKLRLKELGWLWPGSQ